MVACGGQKKEKLSENKYVVEWEFETENYRVKIDTASNGMYRYRSWSKSKQITDEPDLVLENGVKECWCDPAVEVCDCDTTYEGGENAVLGFIFTFKNGEYRYEYKTGWWKGRVIDELLVYNKGEEILRERGGYRDLDR